MWRERTKLLIGKKSLEKLQNSRILICGLGGVGGAAAEQLVRAGVGHLCIVDTDTISETNINRQTIATHNNIGILKTEAFKERLLSINPNLNLSIRTEFLRDEILKQILIEAWDFVVDAIDTLSPKLHLIRICYENNIPFVSSMGSGGKTDPTSVQIADISKSYNCDLAKILRKRLHKIDIYKGITVVFSTQKTDKNAVIEEESQNKKSNVGTISYMPVVFGCMCAYVTIKQLTDI